MLFPNVFKTVLPEYSLPLKNNMLANKYKKKKKKAHENTSRERTFLQIVVNNWNNSALTIWRYSKKLTGVRTTIQKYKPFQYPAF